MSLFLDAGYQTWGAPFPLNPSGISVTSTHELDQTTDAYEWVFQAPKAITITRLGYRLATLTGVSPTFQISLQGVDGSGNPDGTIKGGGSPASATFTVAGSNAWFWVNLANSYTCTRGEKLAIVIKYSSGTIDASNKVSMGYLNTLAGNTNAYPYFIQNAAGVRTHAIGSPVFGYGSTTVAYGAPLNGIVATTFSSDSTPDEYAVNFTVPRSLFRAYTVLGWRACLTQPVAAKTVLIQLYNGTTVLQTDTWDVDETGQSTAGLIRAYQRYFTDTTLATLIGGQPYRIGFAPQQTGSNLALGGLMFDAAADMDAYPHGQALTFSTRTDAGAWTDVPTQRPAIELILGDRDSGRVPHVITAS